MKIEAPCGHRTRSKGRRSRSVVTAVGKIALARDYRVCRTCHDAGFPVDVVLGLDGAVTRRALRLICHVGASDSFARGERTLRELMGWSVDAETIRRRCHAEAAVCRENQAEQRAPLAGKVPEGRGCSGSANRRRQGQHRQRLARREGRLIRRASRLVLPPLPRIMSNVLCPSPRSAVYAPRSGQPRTSGDAATPKPSASE